MSVRGLFICLYVVLLEMAAQAQPLLGTGEVNYVQGHAFVKIREGSRALFEADNTSSRIQAILPGITTTALSRKSVADRKANRSSRTKAPHVDISLYYQVTFDPAIPLSQAIDQLMQSGHFEKAEPVPLTRALYTPNDVNVNQYYLQRINALQAWDVTKGSSNVVVAIIDTGGELTHPDLAGNLYYNKGEIANNGIDDDNDGYIDNVTGWDFGGADTVEAVDPNFKGDNDPSIHRGGEFIHGTLVAGCASASTDNGIGIAGVGFNTKILFTKHTADNAVDGSIYLYNVYQGVIYAAETLTADGVKAIINCSFGGEPPTTIIQDVINYVTLDLGCLVVAAAGNSANEVLVYPASYDNVISVAATAYNDLKANFSTYNTSVDIAAPGQGIYSTTYDNTYSASDGTSFSAPIVAGAAALVWAVYPDYTFDQVAELIRISADSSIYSLNPAYRNKLGSGRLDVYNAVTLQIPSLHASNLKLLNKQGYTAGPGDSGLLYIDIENLLAPTSANLSITISTSSPGVTMNRSVITPGVLATKQIYSNTASPFVVDIDPSIPQDQEVDVTISYSDGTYQHKETFSFILNPSYLNADENQVLTSITSTGRLGYTNVQTQSGGVGFQLNGTSLLSEMGLIMGSSSSSLLDNVRSDPATTYDQDLVSIISLREITPGPQADKEIVGSLSNSATPGSQQIVISYRAMDWITSPNDKFVIMEYTLKNPTAVTISNYFFGIFADWNISSNGAEDAAAWNDYLHLGYVYGKSSTSLPYGGIQQLTPGYNYYAIDNDAANSGGAIALTDGFTDTEKFASISSGIARTIAGTASLGDDVSHVVSAGPLTIPAGQQVTVAFALHGATDQTSLFNSALYADSLYNIGLKLTKPLLGNVAACPATQVILAPSGGTTYNWYTDSSSTPFLKSSFYTINAVEQSQIIYVTSTVGTYESKRDTVQINLFTNPIASFTVPQGTFLNNQTVQFTDTSVGAAQWSWDFGDNATSNATDPTHVYNSTGAHKVSLQITSSNGCKDTVSHVLSVITGIENNISSVEVYPNPVKEDQLMIYINQASPQGVAVSLTDMQGKSLYNGVHQFTTQGFSIPMSGLAEGLYILTVTDEEKVYRTKVVRYK